MTKNAVLYSSLQDSPIDKNITAEKLKQIEKELQDEAAKKNAAIKVRILCLKFSLNPIRFFFSRERLAQK